jgi:hypothetical protein
MGATKEDRQTDEKGGEMTYATLDIEPQVGDLVGNHKYTMLGLVVETDDVSVWCKLIRYDLEPTWVGKPLEYPRKHFKINYHPQP